MPLTTITATWPLLLGMGVLMLGAGLQGTLLGFPRDSWVQIPGHGNGKLTNAMALGGPTLMAETIRRLTGLPVQYYVITGFQGFTDIVNELGGVDVNVQRRMNDGYSGARFQPGWHHFDGGAALAYSRDRHDVAEGDFTRSGNQGNLVLAALGKMRHEVRNDDGLRRWIGVLLRHAALDSGPGPLLQLAALARRLDRFQAKVDRLDDLMRRWMKNLQQPERPCAAGERCRHGRPNPATPLGKRLAGAKQQFIAMDAAGHRHQGGEGAGEIV